MKLEFCRNKGHNNIVCDNDCLEVVELVNAGRDRMIDNNTLHVYATYILHIINDIHETDSTTLAHIHRK
jgi:hypothetical protein